MANGHGGQRDGAGRKPKRVKFPKEADAADKRLAAGLDMAVTNLLKLAKGGLKRETKIIRRAGLCQMIETEEVSTDSGPKLLRHVIPIFPDKKPDEMVVIEHKYETLLPDRAAIEAIIDRIMGTPGTLDEHIEEVQEGSVITEEARKAAMEKHLEWRKQSVEQLLSIRNPLTGQTMEQSESESTNEASSQSDSTITDEF